MWHLLRAPAGPGLPGEAAQEEALLAGPQSGADPCQVKQRGRASQAESRGRGVEVCEPLECSENSEDMVWLEPKAHWEIQKELLGAGPQMPERGWRISSGGSAGGRVQSCG